MIIDLYLQGITKLFGNFAAVDDVELQVHRGELLTLLGPSGCGKTTTLRIIGGFLSPDRGEVFINGEAMTNCSPNERDCGFVFQNYALFPHMTVFDNIAYGLKLRKIGKTEIRQKVDELAEMVSLSEMLGRYPRQLSGGQQQRVAIARALAIGPKLLLLDEPLSNLDAKLREKVRFELRTLQQKTGITAIYVTHDQAEAMVLSDRVAVMNKGRIEQIGSPQQIYFQPQTHFVADFIGQNNFIAGTIIKQDKIADRTEIRINDQSIVLASFDPGHSLGQKVTLCVRPEILKISGSPEELDPSFDNRFRGRVDLAAFLGSETRYEVDLDIGIRLKVPIPADRGKYNLGSPIGVGWRKEEGYTLPS